MRIIAGYLGGRRFASPASERVHPMSERVRGGLFNSLGDLTGLTILDAFAGSGALGFEALSRGAAQVTAIDIDKKAHAGVVQNAKSLSLGRQLKIIRANASGWSDKNPSAQFDIVLADPPFDDLQLPLLVKLTLHVRKRGLLVLNWPGHQPVPEIDQFESIKRKNYGDTQLVFYRRV